MPWRPNDNFYDGYSLWHIFGYGPEGEVNRAKKTLALLGYETSDEEAKELLELTRDLHRFVRTECSDELVVLSERSDKLLVAGEAPPFDISLAVQVAELILMAAATGVAVLDYLRKNKTGSKAIENADIVESALKKLSTTKKANELIVQKTERWQITYKKRKAELEGKK